MPAEDAGIAIKDGSDRGRRRRNFKEQAMSEQLGWWPFPWLNFAPARLDQPILPDWSLQRIEVNFAGDAAIEKEVVAKVASYGKQLGIITEAVLALAGDAPAERAQRLDRLRAVAAKVEEVKQ